MENKEKDTQHTATERTEQTAEEPKLSQADIERMAFEDYKIRHRLPKKVIADGRTYKVRRINSTVRSRIEDLALTSYYIQQQSQKEITLRQAKRLNRRLRNTHAKIAAYYLLGKWALFVPFLWMIRWRLLALRTSEAIHSINSVGANDPDTFFYLANCNITNDLRALFTKQVGKEITKYESRKESAENMAREDGLKKEDSKSGTSSKRPRTTKR